MAEKPVAPSASPDPFELKMASFSLPVMRLLAVDLETLLLHLGNRIERAPDFFRNTPIVIDLTAVNQAKAPIDLPQLVKMLRGYGLLPVGVSGANTDQALAAQSIELAVLRDGAGRRPRPAEEPPAGQAVALPNGRRLQTVASNSPPPPAPPAFTLITKPVRSGQRIYAEGGDLSIVAPVSSGAELMADGNIHVYGPLRGRALAGMRGNTEARIFCQDLQAELISIAGHYRVSEGIPNELRGVPVQVFLDQQILRIERL
ncbi:septum site-determining protein MinC [Caldichromatium japonicum]|uniref:Probable septum site-determining protein MinC n=1 Tax=Caldichromatium japonicum TaxID=2699430 RepID=A0A6G7VD74_9GAMM|nr:septum site-determining protein MinC [Caldichromatium japonicum]QIK37835.1 septum site-determining protein MinC [Caldichromatium japonicum]